jgi:hypothetical protein
MMLDPQQELLSAYLDGEVTAEEKAAVEQRLTSDVALRQLYEDLRTQRGAIRSLPHYRAPAELARLVSERLNQQAPPVRRATASAVATAVASSSAVESSPIDRINEPHAVASDLTIGDRVRQRFTARALFWPALAIAAALLVMFQSSQEPGAQRDVAKGPTKSIPSGDLVAGPPSKSNDNRSSTAIASKNSDAQQATDDNRESARNAAPAQSFADRTESAVTVSPRESNPDLRSQAMTAANSDRSLRQSIQRGEVVVIECELTDASSASFARLLEQQGIRFDAPKTSAANNNGRAILVEATPESIAGFIAALTDDPEQLANVTVRAGSAGQKALSLAGSPFLKSATENAAGDSPAPASRNKPSLKPQAATVEKSTDQEPATGKESSRGTARPLTLSAGEILRAVDEAEGKQASQDKQARASEQNASLATRRQDVDDKVSVIFILKQQADGPSDSSDTNE